MIKNIRDVLAILYLPFLLIWVFGLVVLGLNAKLNTFEVFGLGTATGILFTSFALMWQFYFRKKDDEK